MLRVALSLTSAIFSEGVEKILSAHDDMNVSRYFAATPVEGALSSPDVVLVDYAAISAQREESAFENMKLILLDTGCSEKEIVSAVIQKGIKGVLGVNSTSAHLRKAITAVATGDVWLDKMNVKSLIAGLKTIKKRAGASLSDREREVVDLVGQGLKNREIAQTLCISEATVKAHLQRIFKKLNVSSRPQLINYAIRAQGLQIMSSG